MNGQAFIWLGCLLWLSFLAKVDINHRQLTNSQVLAGLVVWPWSVSDWSSWFSLLAFGLAMGFAYSRRILGAADVKVFLVLLALFGWGRNTLTTWTVLVSHLLLISVVVGMRIFKLRTRDNKLPFVPFIAAGFAISHFYVSPYATAP